MPQHRCSSPIKQPCLEVHGSSSSVLDAATDPLVTERTACCTMRADKFTASLISTQQQGNITSGSTQCALPSISKREDFFCVHEKKDLESKSIYHSLDRSERSCDEGVLLNMLHSQTSRDLSPLENSNSYGRSSYIPSRFLKFFNDSELQASKRQAMSDYIIIKNKLELRELLLNAEIMRGEIEDAALSQLQAIHTRFCKELSKFSMLAGVPGRRLLKFQGRLKQRENLKNAENAKWEAQLLAEGRCAWQDEVKAQEEKSREEVERSRLKKIQENQFRAAIVFIVCRERTDRGLLEGEVETAWNELCGKEANERKEAEQLAYERFMNSPEQLALAAERERKALRERKKKARLQRILQSEQKRIIERCHHGRNGTSLLENPGPQKACCRCRIRFDEHLGYYISSDANNSSGNPQKRK
ncbi:unnamed protein product [Phytomonas sp. EM1]|nr:unnamed protein product [Phytomonas sp. EM1]|eukprot:CCW65118.1 unnamed protein product [Phytomonas sp. isolate EM1]